MRYFVGVVSAREMEIFHRKGPLKMGKMGRVRFFCPSACRWFSGVVSTHIVFFFGSKQLRKSQTGISWYHAAALRPFRIRLTVDSDFLFIVGRREHRSFV